MIFFLGKTEAEWLQELNDWKAHQRAIRLGQKFVTTSTGGKSFSIQVLPYDQVERGYAQAWNALQILNPTTYGTPTSKTYVSGSSFQFK